MNHGMIKTAAAAKKHKKKTPVKKTQTMEIHESIERIAEGNLSDMGLFELSIHALMPTDVFRELKRRIERIQKHLNICQKTTSVKVYTQSQSAALDIVNNLLKSPQKTRR